MGNEGHKEEVAVIGGGLGGCLTALMLIKEGFHVTLIEGQDALLNGTCTLAGRLHLGGEYPKDWQTAMDCLESAVVWKMLMPDDIYTKVTPMRFTIAMESQLLGKDNKNGMEIGAYLKHYDEIRLLYEEIVKRIAAALGWEKRIVEENLFGPSDKPRPPDTNEPLDKKSERKLFYSHLSARELSQYGNVSGGIQTQELGLNIPKYLAMIQLELEKQQSLGKLTILTGHKVDKEVKGKLGDYIIHCENGREIRAQQVIQAAQQGGPEITPKSSIQPVTIYKRAMLSVGLPSGWDIPPAFKMQGIHGGMLAPLNDGAALTYIPMNEAAYVRTHHVSQGPLPENWNSFEPYELEKRKSDYIDLLAQRFPPLGRIPEDQVRMEMRDLVTFQRTLSQRHRESVNEVHRHRGASLAQQVRQIQDAEQWSGQMNIETKPGFFTNYPTKATYVVATAIQAADMVKRRSQSLGPHPRDTRRITAPNALDYLLSDPERLQKYSLKGMQEPNKEFYDKFFLQHPGIDRRMLGNNWPEPIKHENMRDWVDYHRVRLENGKTPFRSH